MCENEIAAVGSLFSLMVCSFICLLVCVLACKFYRMPFNNVVSSFSLSFGGAEKGKLCTLLPYYYRALLLLAESAAARHTQSGDRWLRAACTLFCYCGAEELR